MVMVVKRASVESRKLKIIEKKMEGGVSLCETPLGSLTDVSRV